MTEIAATTHLYAAFEQELVTTPMLASLYGPYPEAMALTCLRAGAYTFDPAHTTLADLPPAATEGMPTLSPVLSFQSGVLHCEPLMLPLGIRVPCDGAILYALASAALRVLLEWPMCAVTPAMAAHETRSHVRVTFPLGLVYVRGLTPAWMQG